MGKRFTLFELVVVMAILGIMTTLLLPALSNARNKFKSSACISNLQSIGRNVSMYSDTFDGYSIPASFGDTSLGYLNHFINYMISVDGFTERSFQCPQMSKDEMFDPAGHDPATGNIYTKASYIMNIVKPGNWSGSGLPNSAQLSGWGIEAEIPVRVAIVKQPSAKFLILDVASYISNNHSGVNFFTRTDHGAKLKPPVGFSRWIGAHHNGRFNSVFGDGHVESLSLTLPSGWAVNY